VIIARLNSTRPMTLSKPQYQYNHHAETVESRGKGRWRWLGFNCTYSSVTGWKTIQMNMSDCVRGQTQPNVRWERYPFYQN